ncbi:MAG: cell envelope integrity protein TolA [Dokdonella sp.]
MDYRNRVTGVVILVLACVVLDGCATAKKLVPWSHADGDAKKTSKVDPRDDSEPRVANRPPATPSTVGREMSSKSELSSDESNKPVDLSVPRVERDQSAIAYSPQSNSVSVVGADAGTASTLSAESSISNGSTGADEWGRAVQQAIHSRWVQPRGPNIPTDFSCDVRVKLTPFGGVNDVKIVRSCGDVALDASIETAVRESSPLPTPKDPADFSDTLLLTFTPR